jgi:hypothetical protein
MDDLGRLRVCWRPPRTRRSVSHETPFGNAQVAVERTPAATWIAYLIDRLRAWQVRGTCALETLVRLHGLGQSSGRLAPAVPAGLTSIEPNAGPRHWASTDWQPR